MKGGRGGEHCIELIYAVVSICHNWPEGAIQAYTEYMCNNDGDNYYLNTHTK